VRTLVALIVVGLLEACNPTFTRAEQDNFTLHAGKVGIQPFVAALERRLGTSAQSDELNLSDSDVTRLFSLSGRGVTVVVNPVPDDHCNPNAPFHSTYRNGEYRIDLVYETSSQAERQAAKRILADSAKEVGQGLIAFKECNAGR
jgi:hypothetical protein